MNDQGHATKRKGRGRIANGLGAALTICAAPASAGPIEDRTYQPVSLADTEVEFRGAPPQAVQVVTGDGLTLEGAYWPPDDGVDQLVLVFHGGSYNHRVMAYRAEPLREGGRGVLVASYRGYGDNPGKPHEEGLFRDAEAWLAEARRRHPGKRLVLFGFSLGGAVALEMAARHDVAGVATLGAFTRLKDMAPPILRPLVRERYDNVTAVGRVEEPVFLLHGGDDEVVDPEMAERLEEAGGPNVTRINIAGGKHWVPLDRLARRFWALFDRPAPRPNSPEAPR